MKQDADRKISAMFTLRVYNLALVKRRYMERVL